MNRKKKKRGAEKNGRLRDQLRKAAEGLKDKSERAKNMNEETKKEQDAAQETQSPEVPETQSLEDDAQALAAELEKVKAQCDEYLDLAQRKQAEFANYRRRTEGIRQEAYDDGRRDAIDKLLPIVDICKAKQVKIITITESLESPLAAVADVTDRAILQR